MFQYHCHCGFVHIIKILPSVGSDEDFLLFLTKSKVLIIINFREVP